MCYRVSFSRQHSSCSPLCLSALLSCGFFVVSCSHAAAANWARKLDSQPGPFARLAYPRLVRARSMAFRFRMLAQQCWTGEGAGRAMQGLRPFCKWFDLWFWHSCVCVRVCVCRELVKLWQQLSILWVAQFMRTLCVAQVVTRRRTGAAFGVATLCNVRMCAGGAGVRSAWRWQVRVAPDSSGSCDDDAEDWFNRFGAEQLAKSQAL